MAWNWFRIGFWGIAKRLTPRYNYQLTPSCVSINFYHPWAFLIWRISETKNQKVNASLCRSMLCPIHSYSTYLIVLLFFFLKWPYFSILTFDRLDIVGGTFGGYYSPTKLTLQILAGVLRNLTSCLCSLTTLTHTLRLSLAGNFCCCNFCKCIIIYYS